MIRPVTIAPSVLAADFKRLGDEARRRLGRRRLDRCRHHGRPLRAGDLVRPLDRQGDPQEHRQAAERPPDGRRARALPGALSRRRRRPPADPGRARLDRSSAPSAQPSARTRAARAWFSTTSRRSPGSSMSFMVDVILVMTVNPGFGGQAFLPEMLPKIAALRQLCDARGLAAHIEVMAARSLAPPSSPSRPGPISSRRERRSSVQTTTPKPSPTRAIFVREPAKPWTARSLSQCLPMPKNLKRRAHRRSCWRH